MIVDDFKKSFINNIKFTRNYIIQISKKILNNIVSDYLSKEYMNFVANFLESLTKFKEEILHKVLFINH
jgi:hypothetical protein